MGNKWEGDFSDYLDLATKDMLTTHGLYPTVLAAGARYLDRMEADDLAKNKRRLRKLETDAYIAEKEVEIKKAQQAVGALEK